MWIPHIYTIETLEGLTSNVVLVGAGGVGARLAGPLIQLMRFPRTGREGRLYGANITIVDHDTVEERNLVRQHFTRGDIGRSKAEVLAARYAQFRTENSGELVGQQRMLDRATLDELNPHLLILAVDTPATRRMALDWARQHESCIVIDCGTDGNYGQVILYSAWLYGQVAFPEIFHEDDQDTRGGCGTLDTQTLTGNQMAASLALNYITAWWYGIPLGNLGALFDVGGGVWQVPAERMGVYNSRHRVRDRLDHHATVFPGWTKANAPTWTRPAERPELHVHPMDRSGDPFQPAQPMSTLSAENEAVRRTAGPAPAA